jgi:hypothetical protein
VLISVVSAYRWALAKGRSDGEARALAFAAIVLGNPALIIMNRSEVLHSRGHIQAFALAAFAPTPTPSFWRRPESRL